MALALAVESCCATMIAARPAYPSDRRRNGGLPDFSDKRDKPRIGFAECRQRSVQIGLGMDT